MKNLLFVLAFLLVFPAVFADDDDKRTNDLTIQQVFVSFSTDQSPDLLLIKGLGFTRKCDQPVVMIEGEADPLDVVFAEDEEVMAALPVLHEGNFGLTVTCKKKSDTFDFAIGTIGPEGPPGSTEFSFTWVSNSEWVGNWDFGHSAYVASDPCPMPSIAVNGGCFKNAHESGREIVNSYVSDPIPISWSCHFQCKNPTGCFGENLTVRALCLDLN